MSQAKFDDETLDLNTINRLIRVRRLNGTVSMDVGFRSVPQDPGAMARMTPDEAEHLALTLLVMAREARRLT